jgi:hypothetical protein
MHESRIARESQRIEADLDATRAAILLDNECH